MEQAAGVSSAPCCFSHGSVRKSRSVLLPITNSAISVRFSAEAEPTDWVSNNAIRSNLFFLVQQQESRREVIATRTRLEMFNPDLQLCNPES